MDAFAEINEAGDRIQVTFPYDPNSVRAVKAVPGARFIPPPKGGPHWLVPLDLTSARILREQFGDGLILGDAVKAWGTAAVQKEKELTELSHQDDAKLSVLPRKLPKLTKWLRPYQRADIAFLARANAINSNQPGLGKTAEVIGAVFEAKMDKGPQLVIAPKTSLRVVWQEELERWQKHEVIILDAELTDEERHDVLAECELKAEAGKAFWLVTNPAMIRYVRDRGAEPIVEKGKRVFPAVPVYPQFYTIEWATLIVDEYHKMGLANDKTLTRRSVEDLKREKLILMSGTPMGGKPIKLWSALNLVDPGSFTSKWRWADQWLEVEDVDGGSSGMHKVIHGIRDERMEQFYVEHAPYLLRRTKEEVLTELPPKQRIVKVVDMMPEQRKQYESVAAEAEIKIEEEHLSITGVLAEYTRLKQFSDCYQKIQHMADGSLKLLPVAEKEIGTSKSKTVMSGKLPQLEELLNERGITGDSSAEGDEQVVIFSQYSSMVDTTVDWLRGKGIECSKITGAVNRKGERTRLVEEFQGEGGPRVMVMTTGAGGVSINLDKASTVIFLDETWDPDDQEQAEDRVHRASRMHQVTCYYIRSRNSIEEYIANITKGKRLTNEQVLDLHRMLAQAAGVQVKERGEAEVVA